VRRRLLSDAPIIDRAVGLCAIDKLAEMHAVKFFQGNMPGGIDEQSRERKRRSVVAVMLPLHFGPLSVRKL
jgi:hypothetical protein